MITLSEEMSRWRMILPSALWELSQSCFQVSELSVSHSTAVLTKAAMTMTLGLCRAEDLGLLEYHRGLRFPQMETLLLASLFV